MKLFLKRLFCIHKWELEHTDNKAVQILGYPVYHYKCLKCNKKVTKIEKKWKV